MPTHITHGLVAGLIFSFSAFLLYITRPVGGGLDTSAVALCGPLLGAVAAYYFQSAASGQGAAISAGAATAALAASSGQPTITQSSGGSSVRTGSAAIPAVTPPAQQPSA